MPEQQPRNWLFDAAHPCLQSVDASIGAHYLADEPQTVESLLKHARLPQARAQAITDRARRLVESIRCNRESHSALDAFLGEYDLASAEGVMLMCLAEALLRIPDAETADRLIADKLTEADWEAHLGSSESVLVNASTWALMLTGRLLDTSSAERPAVFFRRLIERLGEPVVRGALRQAMRILGHQFVMGRTIDEALERAARAPAYSYSYDMLGEAALTAVDAARYFDAYAAAIEAVGQRSRADDLLEEAPGVSVKLSALFPRYEFSQSARAVPTLCERLLRLAVAARDANIALTVDAEEANRLELSLAVFERVFRDPSLSRYCGLGIAVQAYQKRARHVVQWLEELAGSEHRVIPVRLVKGAYWDSEIKHAQEQGLDDYPVFTRKRNTDVSYLACAQALLQSSPHLYPQFATHNAHTVAWLLETGARERFEFQRLHGMGEALYGALHEPQRRCRVYAPVGTHEDLLPYLVRRLLENGANTSFVNRLIDAETPIERIVADPIDTTASLGSALRHPRIPLPRDLFVPERPGARGLNLADAGTLETLRAALGRAGSASWHAAPLVGGRPANGPARECRDPADRERITGSIVFADRDTAGRALELASRCQSAWNGTPAAARAACLRRAADLFEAETAALLAKLIAEGGRTVSDGIGEIREAIDFLRYYAARGEALFGCSTPLPGPTGERNEWLLRGRGVFLCISPWNFPLSIFTGQAVAALMAGNTVIAKPAEQTCLVASQAVELLHRAGVPAEALQFLPGDGAELAAALLPDPRIAGVAFTGSVPTARRISRELAGRDGPLAALIAETGGVNAMIVDSSALPEQVVRDAAQSAFASAGQRCSALRLLCLQEDTADRILTMLEGHMAELAIGDPALLATDVGPIIDEPALERLRRHVDGHKRRVRYQCPLTDRHRRGHFFPPTLIELDSAGELVEEVFGPVLHVVRYREDELQSLIDAIHRSGYGLTLGIHSRIGSFAKTIAARARVGNIYVNRNMIGAQVGSQPFGGMGLSGTGPKAGGPHYLLRFAAEQAIATNTAAVGGNATLLSLGDDAG